MKNYLCILRSEAGNCDEPSPADMQKAMDAFTAWSTQFKDNIVDLGGQLGDGGVWTTKGVTDGPYVESKEIVGGFMILTAETLEQTMDVGAKCPPIANSGASVEVREIRNG